MVGNFCSERSLTYVVDSHAHEQQNSICPCVYAGENLFSVCAFKIFSPVYTHGRLQEWRLWFQCRCVVLRVEAMVSMSARCSKGEDYGSLPFLK